MGLLAIGCSGGRLVKDWLGRGGEVLFDGGSVGVSIPLSPSPALKLGSAISRDSVQSDLRGLSEYVQCLAMEGRCS